MKKITAIILILAITSNLTACNKTDKPQDSGNSSAVDSGDTPNIGDSEDSDSEPEPAPERPKPDGEPTFLICPDGEPIYTSEISQFLKYVVDYSIELAPDEEGSLENFTAAQCDGFVYGYIPEKAVNFVENPELFEFRTDNREYRYYQGEEYPPSTEFIRIYEGDKFGDLTVSRAYSIFSGEFRDLSDEDKTKPGAYFVGGCLELDGEIELTGYMLVEEDGWYNSDGDLYFFPDTESSAKLPNNNCYWDRGERELFHDMTASFYGYYGDYYGLGNMNDYDIDFDGLKPGDDFVKVKVTLGDIRYYFHDSLLGSSNISLKSVERL